VICFIAPFPGLFPCVLLVLAVDFNNQTGQALNPAAKIYWPDQWKESLFIENPDTCYEYPIKSLSFCLVRNMRRKKRQKFANYPMHLTHTEL
jgi:hypothetical protein